MPTPFSLPPDAAARMAMLASVSESSEFSAAKNEISPRAFAANVEDDAEE